MSDIKDAIRRVLGDGAIGWLSSRAVHRLADIGAESTVSKYLTEMANNGEIDHEMRQITGGTIAMYRGKP